MINVCDCNLGCAKVPLAGPALVAGAQATVEKGPLVGETVKVIQTTDKAGASVLALTDLKHDHACEAATSSKALLGYACEASKSGPVPAKACAKGCD